MKREEKKKKKMLSYFSRPVSETPTYLVLVHENLDLYSQLLHLDPECNLWLGKLDHHPKLQIPEFLQK